MNPVRNLAKEKFLQNFSFGCRMVGIISSNRVVHGTDIVLMRDF